jgi:DNA-binding response OmpR family regulator
MAKILLVEDSIDVQLMVKKVLFNHEVIATDDPDQVKWILHSGSIDLILLDIAIAKRDGYSVLTELRSEPKFSSILVICLTARSSLSDKVTAFNLGVDDFIVKPFDSIDLRIRVEARINKLQKNRLAPAELRCGTIRIDMKSHLVRCEETGTTITLTQTELKIFCHFARYPQKVFSREELINVVWGQESAISDRAVDVQVCSLRKKLSDYGINFHAIPRIGYRLSLSKKDSAKLS